MVSETVLILLISCITAATIATDDSNTNEGSTEGGECIKISDYTKPEKGQPCKELGSCFQYRCGGVARHCSECEARKGPCKNYSSDDQLQRSKRSTGVVIDPLGNLTSSSSLSGFLDTLRSQMRSLADKVNEIIATSETPTAVPVEKIGNAIVHIRAGSLNCSGFLSSVDGPQGRQYIIMTAAQCLVKFETECRSSLETFGSKFNADRNSGKMIDGYMTYDYKHAWPCFGDYDSDILTVKKSFRSYSAIVTSYSGRSFKIPLTSKQVIVPRDYMECQDCRYDFAAIKLENRTARAILGNHQPFLLTPEKDSIDSSGKAVTQFVTVAKSVGAEKFRKATNSKFCTVSYTTQEKLCFKLPIAPTIDNPPQLLPGSPLFIPHENTMGEIEYQCIGIFTGSYNIVEESLSTDNLLDEIIDAPPLKEKHSVRLRYSKNGAVRITQNLVSFLEKLSGVPMMRDNSGGNSRLQPLALPARKEFFPSVLDPYDKTAHLYLCTLGWKDEKDHCRKPDHQLTEECTWDGSAFSCEPRRNGSTVTNGDADQLFMKIVIPGTTQRLSLPGYGITDLKELQTMLRELHDLEALILDDNKIRSLHPSLLVSNQKLRVLSLKNNRIARISSNTFWRNPYLRHVDLAHNEISSLNIDLLVKCSRLEYFNIEDNKMRVVSGNLLRNNFKMERLYLGNNNITQLAAKSLQRLINLQEFHINNNSLIRIANGLFSKNRNLHTVDFSRNSLTAISKNTFDHNQELRFVNLNYNRITLIPYRLFSNQRKLQAVNASKNPLLHPDKTQRYFRTAKVPYV